MLLFLEQERGWYGIKAQPGVNYNADLDRRPYREVQRRDSEAVSMGAGRARRVQLLMVPRRVRLVTYLG